MIYVWNYFKATRPARMLILFTTSIKKEEDYLDGAKVEFAALMQLALNKYVLRKNNGEWRAPSSDQE